MLRFDYIVRNVRATQVNKLQTKINIIVMGQATKWSLASLVAMHRFGNAKYAHHFFVFLLVRTSQVLFSDTGYGLCLCGGCRI